MSWINCNNEPPPRGERYILAKHKYGIEYIYFGSGAWRYCYRGDLVDGEFLETVTHWLDPKELDEHKPLETPEEELWAAFKDGALLYRSDSHPFDGIGRLYVREKFKEWLKKQNHEE